MTEFILAHAREAFELTIHLLVDASFYLLVGFLVAGVLKGLVPADRIIRHIGRPTFSSVFKASLIGTPLPLCSCSVIPVATSLRRSGASKGATVSFLVSTPESGVDSIAISYAMLDPLMTVFRPIAALVTGFAAGVMENLMHDRRPTTEATALDTQCSDGRCDEPITPKPESRLRRLAGGIRYAFTDLLGDVAYYLVFGLLISALITAFIPSDFFEQFIGHDFAVMIVMLVAGIPMYVCASASTPIAAALILKGVSPGAALVFLLAGPATNLATIGVVRKLLGTRSVISYLACIGICALFMGVLLNGIYREIGMDIRLHMQAGAELIPDWLKIASAAVLTPLLMYGIARETSHRFSKKHS